MKNPFIKKNQRKIRNKKLMSNNENNLIFIIYNSMYITIYKLYINTLYIF